MRLPTPRDVVDKIAYCAANPVAAALVDAPDKWPGVNLWLPGSSRRIARLDAYFDPDGNMPNSVELRCEPPTTSDRLGEWRGRVRRAVAEAMTKARQSAAAQGLVFLGAAAVMKKSFLQRAKTRRSFIRIETASFLCLACRFECDERNVPASRSQAI